MEQITKLNKMNKESFKYTFQITKLITFNIEYSKLSNNKNKHFSTSTYEFIKSKKDFDNGGQTQKRHLKEGTKARAFFDKWDVKHLRDLNNKEYQEIKKDIEQLKEHYNFIELLNDDVNNINFNEIVRLSKMELKR